MRYAFALAPFALAVMGAACTTGRNRELLEQQRTEVRSLEARVAALDLQMARLRARLDSLEAENDSLRRSASRTEADVVARDEQIRALRLELQRLKEIDLRPRAKPSP